MGNIIYIMNMNFENYTIYELRNYARQIGVKSPTTKKDKICYAKLKRLTRARLFLLQTTKKVDLAKT